jgi:hypothetical protein
MLFEISISLVREIAHLLGPKFQRIVCVSVTGALKDPSMLCLAAISALYSFIAVSINV